MGDIIKMYPAELEWEYLESSGSGYGPVWDRSQHGTRDCVPYLQRIPLFLLKKNSDLWSEILR